MANIWTIVPEVVRYDLMFGEHPFYIELKKELTAGEANRLKSSAFQRWRKSDEPKTDDTGMDMELNISWDVVAFQKILIWLTGWSLTNENGDKMPRSVDTLRALRSEVFDLIEKKVDEHAKAMRKKDQTISETTPTTT